VFSQNRRRLLVVFLTSLIVFEMIVYVAVTPRPREEFFQLYVLGANRLLSDYYPNGDPNIRVGELISWYLGVTDFMGSVQLIAIRVRLSNGTIAPPNDLQAQPSPAPLITEYWRFIQDNETWELPFFWQVTNVSITQGSTRILELQINNATYQVLGSTAVGGYNFRIIVELWTWDVQSATLQFGWSVGDQRRAAWLQMWFNMTSPVGQ
jgi:hypothetical protein